eukprot:scaffold16594_cov46-Phaeocystis_antarctica.AAC.2
MGALELRERRLLLVLGALAGPERADVGGESRLLLGRAVVVLEHGVGLGHVIVHRLRGRGRSAVVGAAQVRGRSSAGPWQASLGTASGASHHVWSPQWVVSRPTSTTAGHSREC